MKILILSSEVWNDKINGNNVISNWFTGFDAEFANIYLSPGEPYNDCCKMYFQVTEASMLKSIIQNKPAGRIISIDGSSEKSTNEAEKAPTRLYSFLKPITGSFLRFVREELWLLGKYDLKLLKKFIYDFEPDIIFSERMASCKMLRLEKIVSKLCNAPIVAFTGDDEYSLRQLSFSPFFWINRFMVRKRLREMVSHYKIYYTLSYEQKKDYEKRFGCRCEILQKCANMPSEYQKRNIHNPIRMIYAGKFYCNRWKVLGEIADAIREVNKDGIKIILEIYTKDIPNKKQNDLLNDRVNSFIMGGVSQEELREIYKKSDIAIHVESRDIKNRLATRLSFSTKIIDCIESGCAVLAYCWDKHSGWTYLKRRRAAMCVSSENELKALLITLIEDHTVIDNYSLAAYECGIKYHNRNMVQKKIKDSFINVMNGV